MLRKRIAILMSLVGLSLIPVVSGCASSTDDPGGTGDMGVPNDDYRIDFVTTQRAFPAGRLNQEFVVRYYKADNNENQQAATINFRIEGNANGSTLNASNFQTDAQGQARVRVNFGQPTQFTLFARAEDGTEANAQITVSPATFGDLKYLVSYSGARSIRRVEAGLFGGTNCNNLRGGTVPDPDDARATAPFRQETVSQVSVGDPYAIYALGIDARNNIAAEGCLDINDFAGTSATPYTVPMSDALVRRWGTYDVSEVYDITEGFSPTVQFVFDALAGLTSDPAAWIVDTIANWNDGPLAEYGEIPSSVTSVLDNPVFGGVITDLFRELFASVTGVLPGWLRDFGYAINDASNAFRTMNLRGTLDIPNGNGEFDVNGMHVITAITVPRTGRDPASSPIYAAANVSMTVGETLQVGEHTLNFAFGNLLRAILEQQILSRFNDDMPTTLTDTVRNLVQCDVLAGRISGDERVEGFGETTVNTLCNLAVTLVAATAENLLFTGIANWDRMTLEGSANMRDADGDFDAELLSDGHYDATWTSTTAPRIDGIAPSLAFEGDWTGRLNPDPSATTHPVRARLTARLQ